MTENMPITGEVAARFAPVREAFKANFDAGEEHGAGFCVIHEDNFVVDLHGGYKDRARTQLWDDETLVCVYSTGKAVTSLLIAREVGRGRLDYNEPLASYWPEFAAAGKQDITLGQALSHQAGLCGIKEPMEPEDWLDWDGMIKRLAEASPLWEPGTASGYHPIVFGFLAGEAFRRVTGATIGETLRRDFVSQGIDIFCGLQDADLPRVASMAKPPSPPDLGEPSELKKLAFYAPWSAPPRSREGVLKAELPASNMQASARGIAQGLYPLANKGLNVKGDAVLEQEAIDALFEIQISGLDLVLPFKITWCAGMMRNRGGVYGPSETAFGHSGFGGSCVVVDPARRLTIAYAPSKMSPYLAGDPRSLRLLNAVYDCL